MNSLFEPLAWSRDSNIYEVNLRQYTREGTLNAFKLHLPRLRDMGVEILWFMPVTPISLAKRLGTLGSYYACSDYTSINPEFGSLDDFKILVREAREMGFKVIIDWVANHTGWDHHWTKEHPEYYRRNAAGNFFDPHGWEDVIDLNYDHPELREAMMQCMEFWVEECGIDGFRCDMAMLVPLDFWKTARGRLDARKPLYWLAECEEVAYHEVFDATYTWKMLHTMEDYSKRKAGIGALYEVLDYYRQQFPETAIRAFFTTNHDENSHSGSEDERLGAASLPFAVFCATWYGLPLIYSGQELPNTKRLLFFDKDFIEWTAQPALHEFCKTLLHLRKRNPALKAGDPVTLPAHIPTNADDRVFAFLRKSGEKMVAVLLNLSDDRVVVEFHEDGLSGPWRNVFSNGTIDFNVERTIPINAWGYAVFEK
jgi:alpha-amylase